MRKLYKLISLQEGWVLDEVLAHNSGTFFYHEIYPDGRYIEALSNGQITLGFFINGRPYINGRLYITDADFQPAQVFKADVPPSQMMKLIEAHLSLKACPFCGWQPQYKTNEDMCYFRCSSCNIISLEYLSYRELLEWWNRRTK